MSDSLDTEPVRTVDDHPTDRARDRGVIPFLWRHKLYRDVLFIIGAFFVWQGFIAIQDSRKETLIRSCKETNERYLNTVHELDKRISKIPDPKQRAQAERSKDFTVALIANLAPYTKNCEARADRLLANGD